MKEIELSKNKIVTHAKVAAVFLDKMKVSHGRVDDDFLKDLFTVQLESFVLGRIAQHKEIKAYRKPQKFWDWIRRKDQEFTFEFDCKEILNKPPMLPKDKSTLFYQIEEV